MMAEFYERPSYPASRKFVQWKPSCSMRRHRQAWQS